MLGNGVFTALAQGLAAQQAPAGESATPDWTKAHDGNPCIIGTAGMEAAALTQQGAQPALVEAKQ